MTRLAHKRPVRGSALAELPVALLVMFAFLFFPLINLGTTGMRACFMMMAVQDAVYAAARAQTFQASTADSGASSVDVARTVAQSAISRFSHVFIDSTTTSIISINKETRELTRTTSPLNLPADTGQYLYQIEVMCSGRVYPFILLDSNLLGSVPGLTGPFQLTLVSREYCENPSGLDL